jgi:hypothetical protein
VVPSAKDWKDYVRTEVEGRVTGAS